MLESTVVVATGADAAQLLLGYKKVGFGQGKITCYGGKIEPGESPQACARREFAEESLIDLPVSRFLKVGEILFRFPHKENWDMFCHVYRLEGLTETPVETREIRPLWMALDALPFAQMWADNPHWLRLAVQKHAFNAEFIYRADNDSLERYHVQLRAEGF